MASMKDKEKAQQIQVFVRVRPINKQERQNRSLTSVEVLNSKDISVKLQHNKKYSFDKVFGPNAKQVDIYMSVVHPLIAEVLAGYNCTVFAYGQTGTGKTYTMAGGSVFTPGVSWQEEESAGIIPRALAHLFDEVRLISQEYTIRVSYLELYNEELYDLLSETDDSTRIRLFEDQRQRGSVIIQGIEEQTVHSKNEVHRILEKGQEKRRIASTLMNTQSSRSHTVFSITVHTRESNIDGEQLVKTGKLNLVDLAGSENISRSGAVDVRAREAGNINQSLLTLGRVIKALVERSAHVPYRESKLTRILQDSLGGRTKTSIIATVSPATCCLEETLSTLDYANRARNIINRPEVNQKMSQKVLINQYVDEIERLKKDLAAVRNGTAVYLAPENYERLKADTEIQKEELAEKINLIRTLEERLKSIVQQKEAVEEESAQIQLSFNETKERLHQCHNKLKETVIAKKKEEYLASYYEQNAEDLHKQAETILNVTKTSTRNENILHSKVETLRSQANKNISIFKAARNSVGIKCNDAIADIQRYSQYSKESNAYLLDMLMKLKSEYLKMQEYHKSVTTGCVEAIENSDNFIFNKLNENQTNVQLWTSEISDVSEGYTESTTNFCKKSLDDTFKLFEQQLIANHEHYLKFSNEAEGNLQDITLQIDNSWGAIKTDINERTEEIIQDINKLNETLSTQNKYMESVNKQIDLDYDDIVTCIQSKLQGSLRSAITQNIQLINNCQVHTNSIHQTVNEKMSKIGTKIEVAASDVIRKCTDLSDAIDKNKKDAKELISTNGIQTFKTDQSRYLDEISSDINKKIHSKNAKIINNINIVQNQLKLRLQENLENVRITESQQLNVVEESSSQFNSNIDEGLAKLTELDDATLQFATELNANLNSYQLDLDKCINNEVIHLTSNGNTPMRVNFNYPHELKHPSPRERLLSRYNSQLQDKENISGIDSASNSFLNSPTSSNSSRLS